MIFIKKWALRGDWYNFICISYWVILILLYTMTLASYIRLRVERRFISLKHFSPSRYRAAILLNSPRQYNTYIIFRRALYILYTHFICDFITSFLNNIIVTHSILILLQSRRTLLSLIINFHNRLYTFTSSSNCHVNTASGRVRFHVSLSHNTGISTMLPHIDGCFADLLSFIKALLHFEAIRCLLFLIIARLTEYWHYIISWPVISRRTFISLFHYYYAGLIDINGFFFILCWLDGFILYKRYRAREYLFYLSLNILPRTKMATYKSSAGPPLAQCNALLWCWFFVEYNFLSHKISKAKCNDKEPLLSYLEAFIFIDFTSSHDIYWIWCFISIFVNKYYFYCFHWEEHFSFSLHYMSYYISDNGDWNYLLSGGIQPWRHL